MRVSRAYILIGIALLLLFASCGQRQQAKHLAEQFVEQNASDPSKLHITNFGKLDSTRLLNDSIIEAMRRLPAPIYKTGIAYPSLPAPGKLLLIRMNYEYEGEQWSNTFYFDEGLTQVVAFK